VVEDEADLLLRAKLNGETGRISWRELERHYARAVLIRVGEELDLVEVALRIAKNDTTQIESWLSSGALRRAADADARDWHRRDPSLWAVVTVPWVLVQERASAPQQ
jgi:hypothetical protein